MRLDHLLSKEEKQVRKLVILFSYQEKLITNFPVAMRLGETPVPIPNTMVKTQEADGTMLETAWESRWLPEYKKIESTGFTSDSSTEEVQTSLLYPND